MFGVRVRVVLVADGCTDATAVAARSGWARTGRPKADLHVVETDVRSAGSARHIGAEVGLADERDLHRVWVLSTDADTVVPPDWVERQLSWAARGFDGVAGTVRLHELSQLSRTARRSYGQLLRAARGADGSHTDVFGANLGVRAHSLKRVGGFPPIAVGEDHAVWRALQQHGFRVVAPTDVVVSTSGRTHGRARGGLAELLAGLNVARSATFATPVSA